MTKMEQALGKAIYDAMMGKAKRLNFVDKMVLVNALNSSAEFRSIPQAQQQMFVDVGMATVKALQDMNAAGG